MTPETIQVIQNLGVAGFALFILWKMYDSPQKRFKEKDQELLTEIDKRDKRNAELQNEFIAYTAKTHDSMTKQISENTKALARFTDHLNTVQHQVVIQNNASEKQ